MTTQPPSIPEQSEQARKAAHDEQHDKAPNAKRHFGSPELLVSDDSLSDAEKLVLLQDWDLELSNRLKAEEEGMSASDPIRGSHEARLADEAARVKTLLSELSATASQAG